MRTMLKHTVWCLGLVLILCMAGCDESMIKIGGNGCLWQENMDEETLNRCLAVRP